MPRICVSWMDSGSTGGSLRISATCTDASGRHCAGPSVCQSRGSSRTSSGAMRALAFSPTMPRSPGPAYHSRWPRRRASSSIAKVESFLVTMDAIGSITTTISSAMARVPRGEVYTSIRRRARLTAP